MSRYSSYEYDNLMYELNEFLRDHTVSELLVLVADAVKEKEAME